MSDDSESNVEQPEMMEENNEQIKCLMSKDLPKAEFPNKPTTRQLTQPQTPTAIFNAFFTDEVTGHMVE